jgi:hypothetical protein
VTVPDVVTEARRLYEQSAEVRANLGQVQVAAPLVACAETVPGLCDEVERCLAGMRQLLAERDRLVETVDELSRLAADETVSDAYLRGWIIGEGR